jgi:hypothetical protein
MRPIFKKVDSKSEEAFVARVDQFSQFYNKWHFHPELELTHIVKGRVPPISMPMASIFMSIKINPSSRYLIL